MKHLTVAAAMLLAEAVAAQAPESAPKVRAENQDMPEAQNRIDRVRPDAPELAPYSEHPVGVQTLTLTDEGRIDVVNTTEEGEPPTYDREITIEVWYPAAKGTEPGGTYRSLIRNGVTEVTLRWRALRDATPAKGTFPLVIISHSYPSNRFPLSHLGENLASKGYVTVSVDHPDSTYVWELSLGAAP